MLTRKHHASRIAVGVLWLLLPLAFTGDAASGAAPVGACCEGAGGCVDGVTEDGCGAVGGSYQGDGSVCAQVTCEVVMPATGSGGLVLLGILLLTLGSVTLWRRYSAERRAP